MAGKTQTSAYKRTRDYRGEKLAVNVRFITPLEGSKHCSECRKGHKRRFKSVPLSGTHRREPF